MVSHTQVRIGSSTGSVWFDSHEYIAPHQQSGIASLQCQLAMPLYVYQHPHRRPTNEHRQTSSPRTTHNTHQPPMPYPLLPPYSPRNAPFALASASLSSTSGCLCTLGISPIPTALRIALAILRWFTFRRPVSRECLIRPIFVLNSWIMEKFYTETTPQGISMPSPSQFPSVCPDTPAKVKERRTLYSPTGSTPNTSHTSPHSLPLPPPIPFPIPIPFPPAPNFPFHFPISTLLRSCGAYTSPTFHLLGACRSSS